MKVLFIKKMKFSILLLSIFTLSCTLQGEKVQQNCIEVVAVASELSHNHILNGHHFILKVADKYLDNHLDEVDTLLVNGLLQDSVRFQRTEYDFRLQIEKGNLTLHLPPYYTPIWKTEAGHDSVVQSIKQHIEVILVLEGKKYAFKPCRQTPQQ